MRKDLIMRINTVKALLLLSVFTGLAGGCTSATVQNEQIGHLIEGESNMPSDTKGTESATATFAAGCFWGVEYKFRQLPGVISSMVGYTGGEKENPTYLQVCRGGTGHAEAVKVVFDPARISYEDLLDAFFRFHDPTQLNRQGPDIGKQYRSAIYYHTAEQKSAAERKIQELNNSGRFKKTVVTEVVSADEFYKAEEYHQRYYEKTIKK
jgi:methionine-S-sulfoxide reductase